MPVTTKKTTMPAGRQVKKEKPEIAKAVKAVGFFEAVGRRKTAVARIHLNNEGSQEFVINGIALEKYFSDKDLQQIALSSLEKMGCLGKFGVTAKVSGGGLHGQAEAIRHGISRALTEFDPELRAKLKKEGFLTRDSRMRERKKFGLKRARRAPQWKKR